MCVACVCCVCVCVYTGQNKQRDLRLLHLGLGLCPERLPQRRTSLSVPFLSPSHSLSPPYLSHSLTVSLFAALYTRAFLNQVGDGDKDTTKASSNNKRQLYWFLPTLTHTYKHKDRQTGRHSHRHIQNLPFVSVCVCVCALLSIQARHNMCVCVCVRWGSQNPIDSCLLRNVIFPFTLPMSCCYSLTLWRC